MGLPMSLVIVTMAAHQRLQAQTGQLACEAWWEQILPGLTQAASADSLPAQSSCQTGTPLQVGCGRSSGQ